MKSYLPHLFALGTALCWGCYGPVLSKAYPAFAQAAGRGQSPFKAYVFIGVAYLVLAIIGGLVGMTINGDDFNFFGKAAKGTGFSFAAGTLGALGALALTTAMFTMKKGGGDFPHVIMALVFGGAVTIAAIVSVATSSSDTKSHPMLWVGIGGMLVCAICVAYFTPHAHAPKKGGHSDKPAEAQAAPAPDSGSDYAMLSDTDSSN